MATRPFTYGEPGRPVTHSCAACAFELGVSSDVRDILRRQCVGFTLRMWTGTMNVWCKCAQSDLHLAKSPGFESSYFAHRSWHHHYSVYWLYSWCEMLCRNSCVGCVTVHSPSQFTRLNSNDKMVRILYLFMFSNTYISTFWWTEYWRCYVSMMWSS